MLIILLNVIFFASFFTLDIAAKGGTIITFCLGFFGVLVFLIPIEKYPLFGKILWYFSIICFFPTAFIYSYSNEFRSVGEVVGVCGLLGSIIDLFQTSNFFIPYGKTTLLKGLKENNPLIFYQLYGILFSVVCIFVRMVWGKTLPFNPVANLYNKRIIYMFIVVLIWAGIYYFNYSVIYKYLFPHLVEPPGDDAERLIYRHSKAFDVYVIIQMILAFVILASRKISISSKK